MGDEEEEAVVLSQDKVSKGLSQIARTVDGSSFAYTRLGLSGLGLTDLGDALASFPHLRYIDLSKNAIKAVDAVVSLSGLLALNLRENAVATLPPFTNPFLQVRAARAGPRCSPPTPPAQHVDAAQNQIASLEGVTGPAIAALNVDGSRCGLPGASPALTRDSPRSTGSSGNKLQALDGIAALEALQRLDARQNEIASLQGLAGCSSLKELYLVRANASTVD